MTVKEGGTYFVEIQDLGENGEGIGKIDGLTVFIEGGTIGDRVIIDVEKLKKNYAIGKVSSFIEESPFRIDPPCPVAMECGGCQIQHLDYKKQLEIKEKKVEDALLRIGKLEGVKINRIIGMDNPYRYRNKAQFPVGIHRGNTVIGFYKKGTHEIVDTDSCLIQHEANDRIIRYFKDFIKDKGISIYDEKTGKGILRHIVTRTSFATGEIMVVIVTNGKELPYKEEMVEDLIKEIPKIKSIIQNINTKNTNVVLGDKNKVLYGQKTIIDKIGELSFEISPLSFFQVNPIQTKILYDKVLEYADITRDDTVFDIYCGIGTISLYLAKKAKGVYGIEVVEDAVEDAKRNAKLNGITNAQFFHGKAEEVIPKLYQEGYKADVVVIDPPRKGCEEEVLKTIAEMKPKRIVYVSCKPSTLARDLNNLSGLGYKAVEVQPVDMFPHSMHVECVTLMSRVEK